MARASVRSTTTLTRLSAGCSIQHLHSDAAYVQWQKGVVKKKVVVKEQEAQGAHSRGAGLQKLDDLLLHVLVWIF